MLTLKVTLLSALKRFVSTKVRRPELKVESWDEIYKIVQRLERMGRDLEKERERERERERAKKKKKKNFSNLHLRRL